jgi:hypothetical protein
MLVTADRVRMSPRRILELDSIAKFPQPGLMKMVPRFETLDLSPLVFDISDSNYVSSSSIPSITLRRKTHSDRFLRKCHG